MRFKKHFWTPLSQILVVPRSSLGRPKDVLIFFWAATFFDPSQSKPPFLIIDLTFSSSWKHKIEDPYRACVVFCSLMKRLKIDFRLLGAVFAVFFFRSFSASFRSSKKDSENVELSHILGFASLFCFVFRTSVLWKRRTVERKSSWCCKNVELSNEIFVKSLFCFVFRNTMLRKRRTVERKIVLMLQNHCFSYGIRTFSFPNLGFSHFDQKTIKMFVFLSSWKKSKIEI